LYSNLYASICGGALNHFCWAPIRHSFCEFLGR
jgi:hypothetical protein